MSSWAKGLLFGCVLLIGSFSFVVAQVVDSTDCTDTSNYSEDGYVQKVLENLQKEKSIYYPLRIFTDKDLKTVIRHHQQACCERRIGEEKCAWKLDDKHYYPESPYIFDHLIYVGMRKFDAVQTHCDILGIDCTTREGSTLFRDRRTKVRSLAEDTDGVPPAQLMESFKEYRWDPEDFTKKEGENKIANVYFLMCNEAGAIRKSVWFAQTDIDIDLTNGRWLEATCRDLVQQRYVEEAAYVQTLMVEKWIDYMYKNLKNYLQHYFIDNRMNALVDKFGKMDTCFNMVLKYITKTSCCVY